MSKPSFTQSQSLDVNFCNSEAGAAPPFRLVKRKCGGPRARTSTRISSPKATAAAIFTVKASFLRPFVHPFNKYLLSTYYVLCPILGIRDAAGNTTDTGCQGRMTESGGKETKKQKVSSLQVQMV